MTNSPLKSSSGPAASTSSTKTLDVLAGVGVALVSFYLLSLASAFWTSRLEASYLVWAIALCTIACAVLGFASTRRLSIPIVVFFVMIALVAAGIALGGNIDDFALPLPADLHALLTHGARSPLVIGPMIFAGAVGGARLISSRRTR